MKCKSKTKPDAVGGGDGRPTLFLPLLVARLARIIPSSHPGAPLFSANGRGAQSIETGLFRQTVAQSHTLPGV